MSAAAGLAGAGLALSLVGKVFEGIGNFQQSRRAEDETRTAASQSQMLLDQSTALREQSLRTDFGITQRNVRRTQGRAVGTNLARAGAMGLGGGSVSEVTNEISRTANEAIGDATSQLNLGLQNIDLERTGRQYEIDRGRRDADEMVRNRRWQVLADTTDFFATGLAGASKLAGMS
jgi:hypothetical protein